jgi:uncharacterized membrane protein SpoIIM required for sporulation
MPAAPTVAYSTAAFRREREGDWQAFEALVDRLERGSISRLSDEELLALPRLYRATLSSLSLARATSLDAALVAYLEALSMRGYFLLYGVRESRLARTMRFFAVSWPAAVRSLWRETLVIALLLALGTAASWWLVANDPAWFHTLIPAELAGGREPGASAATLRETVYGEPDHDGLSIFATFLFTHNSQVSITAYALGFAFGVPSMMLIFYQGLPLGALLSVFWDAGLGPDFIAWLSIHGTTELFAAILAGACGLRIGTAVAFPGARDRLGAAADAGKQSGAAMLGVIIMLLCAGLLEGFARQMVQSMPMRFAVGGTMLAFWLAYFYMPRRALRDAQA